MKKTKLLGLAVLSMLIFSCKQEIEDVTTEPESIVNPVELGEILENPYSVANMRKALDNLTGATSITGTKTSGTSVAKMTLTDDSVTSEDLITTTHYYLKFKPKTEEELDIIKRDTTLILFDFPLDVETSEGDGYRDPEVPDGQPTYKYTYAKVDHVLPEDVEYEVLEELFLPEELEEDELDVSIALNEEDEAFAQKIARVTGAVALETNSNYENILYALEDEALRITNNLDEEDINVGLQKAKTTGWFSKKWTPKGRISVEDDHKGLIPIKGIKVRVGRWFTWKSGVTDANGEFSTSKLRKSKVYYKMDWEKYHFALRDGGFSSAQYKTGKKSRGTSWNWDITEGEHKYYAHIFRAAYHYYHEDRLGLRRPYENKWYRSQLKIGAFTRSNPDNGVHSSFWKTFGLLTTIKIYTFGKDANGRAFKTEDVYAATIHELAHAAHLEMNGSWDYQRTDSKVKETWAMGVQEALTRMIYPYYKSDLYTVNYTRLVNDLLDDNTLRNTGNIKFDAVTGYTIRELEDALKDQRTFSDWKSKIKSEYDNETEEHLDELFDFWNHYKD